MVEPPKKKSTPSRRARKARRLTERIETASAERRQARNDTQVNVVERRTRELDELYDHKRVMRREVYRDAPQLGGRPVFKRNPALLAGLGSRFPPSTSEAPAANQGFAKTAGAGDGRDKL